MDNLNQQKTETLFDRAKITAGIALFFARILAVPIEFLMHRKLGERYLQMSGFFAAVLLFFFPLLFPHNNPIPLYLFLAAYLVKAAAHRVYHLYLWFSHAPLTDHSKEYGFPHLMRVLKGWDREAVRWVEPPLVFVFGAMLYLLTPMLGFYLMAAAVGLFTCLSVKLVYDRQKLLTDHDAGIEARNSAERLRIAQGR